MIRRPPRSTLDRSSAASDVYKRQGDYYDESAASLSGYFYCSYHPNGFCYLRAGTVELEPVSYTHLRAHETVLDLVCRLLLAKKKQSDLRFFSIELPTCCEHGTTMLRCLADLSV